MTLLFGFLFGPQRLAQCGVIIVIRDYHWSVCRAIAWSAMASLFLFRLAFFSFVATLTNFVFLLLGLTVFAFTLWRRHRHIFRRNYRLRFCRLFRLSLGSRCLLFNNWRLFFRLFSRSLCFYLRSSNILNLLNLRLLHFLLFRQLFSCWRCRFRLRL